MLIQTLAIHPPETLVENPARLGFLLCAWSLGAALAAQEPAQPSVYYGARVMAAVPNQDFQQITGRTGLGVGLFAETEWSPRTVIQTRADYVRFPQTNAPGDPGITKYILADPLTLSANSLAVGFDVRHYLPQAALERCFLLGGVTAVRYEFQTSATGILMDQNGIGVNGIVRFKGKTSLKLGLAAGVGYDFDDHWVLGGRFTTIDIDGVTLATLETSLSYRF